MVGGNDAKTACAIAVLKDIQSSTSIPYSRLAIGFQSHVSTSSFVSKAALTSTFSTLAALGVEAMITELDISAATDSATERYQAAIWGDYLDVSLALLSGIRVYLRKPISLSRSAYTQATATSLSTGTRATTFHG